MSISGPGIVVGKRIGVRGGDVAVAVGVKLGVGEESGVGVCVGVGEVDVDGDWLEVLWTMKAEILIITTKNIARMPISLWCLKACIT
jgi:hypothetical protein